MGFSHMCFFWNLIISVTVREAFAQTVYEALGQQNDLSEFLKMVNRDEVLRKQLQFWSVTVFAPLNEAVEEHYEWLLGREDKVVSYHVLSQVIEKTSFPVKSSTSLAGSPSLYLTVKESPGSLKEYYVNNAKVIRSEEYVSQKGTRQLLYVIDEILLPYLSSISSPPTAFNLLDKPELYDIEEPLSAFRFRVMQEGLEELFMKSGNYTFFIPVGAGVGHSLNRLREVDKWVIRGHIIPETIAFTRSVSFDSYHSEAYDDDIKVELSIINEAKGKNSYISYAQSNTIYSKFQHNKGVVTAKILKANLPVTNGVVHLIENPLMIINATIWQILQQEKHGRLSKFLDLVQYSPDFMIIVRSSREKTLFVPSNEAIYKLPYESLMTLKYNVTAITNLLKLHLVPKSISTDDVIFERYTDYISADNRNSLYFRILGDEKHKTLTVDGLGVKAAVIQPDMGAVDGMVHIIDRILGIPYQTVYLKLQSDPDLKITSDLSNQDAWGRVLNDSNELFTFFVPNNEAWARLKMDMPVEYKQLIMGNLAYDVNKILDRHLVMNKQLLSYDLERIDEIERVDGCIKVIHEPINGTGHFPRNLPPIGELRLESEGMQARIIRPDVQTVNGVIHVIDRVMLKKEDLTESGSPIGHYGIPSLFLIIAFVLVIILF